MSTSTAVWPKRRLVVPRKITIPVAQLSPEILAEAAAAKARLLNQAREDERTDESFSEGRRERPKGANFHE